jgi:hypothetical protein
VNADDPQKLVEQAARLGAEVAAIVPDRALSEKIMAEVMAAWDRGLAQGAAHRAAREAEQAEADDEGQHLTTIRTLGPDDVRARRWE